MSGSRKRKWHTLNSSSRSSSSLSSTYDSLSSASSSSSSSSLPKRRPVQRRTVEKWIVEIDCELNTSVWLKFEMADREHVALLKCSVCSQFATKLESMRNFKAAFIDGSSNTRIPSVKDHAATDMHARASFC